jgi:hypothetical protein
MEKSQILKAIGNIGRASKKLTADIQSTAVACVAHAVQHGDVTLADQLVDALGKGLRRASLRAWFETNGPFVLPKGKTVFAYDKARKGTWDAAREADLMSKPWEEAKPEEAVVSVLDVSEAIDKFMKRLDGMVKDASITVRNKDLLDLMHQQVSIYHAERVLAPRIDTPASAE